jgi:hypothetical protein
MMKTVFQILVLFLSVQISAQVGTSKAVKSQDADAVELHNSCVKNGNKENFKKGDLEKVCECSIEKTLQWIRGPGFEKDNVQERLDWLKRMYAMKLKQKDIDADPHDIFEFNVKFTQECIQGLK